MNRPTETPMRKLLLAGAAIAGLMAASATAEANIFPFSGSGPSGFLAPGSEPCSYGGASPPGTTDVGWGSPGVGAGTTVFTGSIPVSDFEITFQHPLDAAQIAIAHHVRRPVGNTAGCGAELLHQHFSAPTRRRLGWGLLWRVVSP